RHTRFDCDWSSDVCSSDLGIQFDPGSISFATGALNNPPYSGPDFLVAHMSLCAHHPGDLVIHWQFSPPAPITRNTALVDDHTNRSEERRVGKASRLCAPTP